MEMQVLPDAHEAPGDREVPGGHEVPGGAAEYGRLSLAACSICLRAEHDSQWIGSSELIRRLRTFEHDLVPRLRPALCDRCAESIRVRRQRVDGARSGRHATPGLTASLGRDT
jgi:hypothetical protein